ncbi:hypothetical protein WUBG_02789 [Wuchereria bancrofti]|uniref:Uncharacterized protein n=1 Tax=Wuchereria bancrofti TaxID=6293 RepID=J9EUN3_WUCBA|nr:hypothetical protein WUBG_02789 [Wuchereria bancrofti]
MKVLQVIKSNHYDLLVMINQNQLSGEKGQIIPLTTKYRSILATRIHIHTGKLNNEKALEQFKLTITKHDEEYQVPGLGKS